MEKYKIINVVGREHVVVNSKHRGGYTGIDGEISMPDANYRGTCKALCGILKKGQSLDDWKKKNNKR
jgi:hypothetical protein